MPLLQACLGGTQTWGIQYARKQLYVRSATLPERCVRSAAMCFAGKCCLGLPVQQRYMS